MECNGRTSDDGNLKGWVADYANQVLMSSFSGNRLRRSPVVSKNSTGVEGRILKGLLDTRGE